MSDVEEEYIIKCIEEYPLKKGYVAITLVPTRTLQDGQINP